MLSSASRIRHCRGSGETAAFIGLASIARSGGRGECGGYPQTQFGTAITPNNMWIQLLAFQYAGQAAYQKTNLAFIDEWNNAIDMFGEVFSGITLVATTGDGLPNFTGAKVT